jgi:RNA polymerase sigma-70 factor, ECF subfamily
MSTTYANKRQNPVDEFRAINDQRTPLTSRTSNESEGYIERLYNLYGESLYRFALHSMGSPEIAEDLLSEVFLHALESRTFHDYSDEKRQYWLYRVMLNEIRRQFRKKKLRNKARDQLTHYSSNENYEPITNEYNRAIAEALIRLLPAKERDVFVLHYACNMNTARIATILALAPSSVRARLTRGRDRLRTHYAGGYTDA